MWKYDRLKIHKRAMDTYTFPYTICSTDIGAVYLRVADRWTTVTCKNCLRRKQK